MFAFELGDDADGELAVGGYNAERIEGDVHWVNLVKAGYWLVSMDAVQFGDIQTDGAVGGIMDTGMSLIYGPQSQVEAMLDTIGDWTFNVKLNLYEILKCDDDLEVPDLTLTIGGKPFTVPGDDLVLLDSETNRCFFSVAKMTFHVAAEGVALDAHVDPRAEMVADSPVPHELKGNIWLMGDTFLRQYHTVYDYDNEKFGLAELKQGRE